MRSPLAQAICSARRAAGLTQAELGRRIGLKGRAIYRWERDDSRPSRIVRPSVLVAIGARNPEAAAKLQTVFASLGKRAQPAPLPPPPPAPPPVVPRAVLELGVFSMADELDLPARRVRGPLARLLRRLREANLPLDVVQRELDGWIGNAP